MKHATPHQPEPDHMTDPKALLTITDVVATFQDRAVETHLLGGSHRRSSDPARNKNGWAADNSRPGAGATAIVRALEAAGCQLTAAGAAK